MKARKKPPASKTSPKPDLRAPAAQVAEQLKLLTRFLYLYGRVCVGLEGADEKVAQTKQNKANAVASISNLRAGLEKLGQEFHARPDLQRQYLKLLQASESAAEAERLATANRFDEAGRNLVDVAQRLADVLVDVR